MKPPSSVQDSVVNHPVLAIIKSMLRANPPAVSGIHNILGINIDGERVLLVYGSHSGQVFERVAFPPPTDEPFSSMLEALSTMADHLLSLTQAQRLPLPEKLSVSVSGNYDDDTGLLESAPDFPLWKLISLRSQLSLRFNLPAWVAKKADAGVMAEALFGSGQQARNLVFVSFNPTVRLGLIANGSLYRSAGGSSGDIGIQPMPDERHPLATINTFADASQLVALGHDHFPGHWPKEISVYQMISDANSGDPYAIELFELAAARLGQGLAGAAHLLRPEVIIIGHPFCQLGPWFITALRESLEKNTGLNEARLPHIAPSELCDRLPELQALAPAIFAAHPAL